MSQIQNFLNLVLFVSIKYINILTEIIITIVILIILGYFLYVISRLLYLEYYCNRPYYLVLLVDFLKKNVNKLSLFLDPSKNIITQIIIDLLVIILLIFLIIILFIRMVTPLIYSKIKQILKNIKKKDKK